MRLDNLKREGCRDSGIERVAAFFQRGHADSRCDPVGRCHDPEGAVDLGPRGEWVRVYFRHGARDSVKVVSRNGSGRFRQSDALSVREE
jgi:hypothetical protein